MSVIKEKTKSKPIGFKKIIMKIVLSAVCGLVFAGFVVGAFIYLKPQLAELLNGQQDNTIIIQSGNTTEPDKENESENKEQSNTPTPVDVEAWQIQLYETGEKMYDALVEVGENKECEGIVFSTDGQSVIILVANCPGASEVKITFRDGVTATGTVAGQDVYTGLGVVFIKKKDIMPITLEKITPVQWGSADRIKEGQSVICIGSPLGERESIIVGMVTGTGHTVTFTDREHGLLQTSVVSRDNASGFLLNEKGALIGVITHAMDVANEVNWVTAYELGDITAVVEMLANKQALPYLGINGTTVTDEMNKEYGVPNGIYVNGVVEDSPAMIGNIQAGDVITEFNGNEVKTLRSFYNLLLEKKPGESVHITVHRSVNSKYVEMTFEITVGGSRIESRGQYEVY